MPIRRLYLAGVCLWLPLSGAHALDVKPSLLPPVSVSQAAASRLREGDQAVEAQRFEVAQAAYEAAIQAAPQDPSGWIGLARVARAYADWPAAQRALAKAQALAPNAIPLLRAKGQLALDMRQYPAAEQAFQAVVQADPRSAASVADLATAVGKMGRPDEARRLLDETQKGRTLSAPDMLSLAMAYQSVSQPHAALALYDKVLVARPDSLVAQTGRGDSLHMLGRYAPALDAYLVALGLAAPGPQLHFKRARTLESMQWLPEAEAAYRDALRLDAAHVPSHHALRALMQQRGDGLDDALRLARVGLSQSPTASMYDVLGAVHMARKETDAARKALEQAVALAPDREDFARRLASVNGGVIKTASAPTALVQAPSPPPKMGSQPAVVAKPAVVAALTKPVVAAVAAPADPRALVGDRVAQWAAAWSAKDPAKYLSFYGSRFEPARKQPRAAWERDRRARLSKPGEIRVRVDAPVFERQGEQIKVSFLQDYQAQDFKDATRKQLVWELEGGQWRIVRELTP